MYPCPNCRAGLRFDIPKQLLVCDHCDSTFSPYDIGREKDAVERDTFEVTVFTCPQCGGELIADDDTAATFCSYCGGTTVLDSRIKNEKRPSAIIPFKKTKEDCEKAYLNAVNKAIFTPNEFKNPKQLEKFRAIYMPYWVYDLETNVQNLNFEGTKSERKGDYVYEHHYRICGDGYGFAEGITYDASSTFSDDLSEAIAPFNVKDCQKFTPSYFSGFYADTGDVDKALYADDAAELVSQYNTNQTIDRTRSYALSVNSHNKSIAKSQTRPSLKKVDLAVLPVWFLSYKTSDNRMAYAVVNGQTGRVAADLPVDRKKYFGVSALLAAVIFAIMYFVPAILPNVLLIMVLVIAAIMFFLTLGQLKALSAKETLENDQGALFAKHMQTMKENLGNLSADDISGASQEQINQYAEINNMSLRCAAAVNGDDTLARTYHKKTKTKINWGGMFLPLISIILGGLVLLANPVSDIPYYMAAVLCIAFVVIAQIQMINRHNKLTTRKPPQLGRRGGDENA